MYDSTGMGGGLKSAFARVSGQEKKEPSIFEDINGSCCPALTRTERMYGFGICFVLGFAISIGGYFALVFGNYVTFAVLYTVGNIVSICSSGFLTGPMKQLKGMFHEKRRIATVVYLLSIVLTLVVAFASGKPALCIVMIVVQWLALVWYFASYIPYGREMIKSCCKTVTGI